jgi:hypothetical protein
LPQLTAKPVKNKAELYQTSEAEKARHDVAVVGQLERYGDVSFSMCPFSTSVGFLSERR